MASKSITQTATYRHRGYKRSDTGEVEMIFGNDPAPVAAGGVTFELLWDHDVVVTTTVTNHSDNSVIPTPST